MTGGDPPRFAGDLRTNQRRVSFECGVEVDLVRFPMNNAFRAGLLLVNTGTPDSPNVADVKRYLREFLADERVIDIPRLQRDLLVRWLIVPRRSKRSAAAYRQVWTAEGSPLLVHSQRLAAKVQ